MTFWKWGKLWFVWSWHWRSFEILTDLNSIYKWEIYIPHVVRITWLNKYETS